MINPSFQLVKSVKHQTSYNQDFLATVQIKDYNVMGDRKNIFDQQVRNNQRTYDKVKNFLIGQGDYTTGFILDYTYFKNYHKKYKRNTTN